MTPEEYRSQVTVMIVPEQPEHHDPRGGFTGEQTFWLHTYGMDKFDRLELEMRGVPGVFVAAAGTYINTWAYHSIEKCEIEADENLMDESGPCPIVFTTSAAMDPWYTERGLKALRLEAVGVLFECEGNHGNALIH
jgi:hypothetical protein